MSLNFFHKTMKKREREVWSVTSNIKRLLALNNVLTYSNTYKKIKKKTKIKRKYVEV